MNALVEEMKQALGSLRYPTIKGKITAASDVVFDAVLPGAIPGAVVQIGDSGVGQVAKMERHQCKLVPLDLTQSPGMDTQVTLLEKTPTIGVSHQLLGRVISPLGMPMDGQGPVRGSIRWPLHRAAPHPFERPAVSAQLYTGIRSIDGLLSLGHGGRVGLFAGPGQGKSTLLGKMARHCDCDVAVICLAGERGREAGEFVNRILDEQGRRRSVVILATSDTPPAQRVLAIQTATAIAEWFRDEGHSVLLLVDSLTRVVRARRDLDLALGVQAGPGGLAATTMSFLPALLERAAPSQRGSISAVYTVLAQTQGDEFISSEVTSLLDGHILLSKKRADAGKWPAVDVVQSISRLMNSVISPAHRTWATTFRSVLAAYEQNEELLLMGAYTKGSCPLTDAYLRCQKSIEHFLIQDDSMVSFGDTLQLLQDTVKGFG